MQNLRKSVLANLTILTQMLHPFLYPYCVVNASLQLFVIDVRFGRFAKILLRRDHQLKLNVV